MKKSVRICMCLVVVAATLVLLFGSYEAREKMYYGDQSNFITEKAVVDNIIYDDNKKHLVFWLSEIDELYSDSNFIMRGENARVAISNGILEKIHIGDEITFSSAPRYFGDGYLMPIIYISVGEDVILDFNEGHSNLMDSYKWELFK